MWFGLRKGIIHVPMFWKYSKLSKNPWKDQQICADTFSVGYTLHLVSCRMECLLCHLETPDIPKVSLSEWWFLLWQLFAKLWPQKFPRNTDLKVFHTKVLDNIFSHFDIILSFGAVLFTLLGHCSPNQSSLNP
jgi:hypothetical protein